MCLTLTLSLMLSCLSSWTYTCLDLRDKILTKRPTITSTKLERLYIYRASSSADIFVDDIMIVFDAPTTDLEGQIYTFYAFTCYEYEKNIPKCVHFVKL